MWVKTILVHELSSAIIIDSCNAFHVQSSPPASTCSFQLPFVYIFTSSSYICTRISVKWQGYLVDTENLLTYYRLTSNCDELFTRIVFHQYWMKCLNVSRRDRPIPSVLKQRNLATGNTEFSGFCLPVIFYFAAASHFFTTTMITYKTKQHINISYNCIADIS